MISLVSYVDCTKKAFLVGNRHEPLSISTMVGLIAQLLNDWSNQRLRELYQDLQDKGHRRPKNLSPSRKPLRSPALLALDMDKLIADYASGLGTKSLAVKYGVSRPAVALRLRKAGIAPHLPGSNQKFRQQYIGAQTHS